LTQQILKIKRNNPRIFVYLLNSEIETKDSSSNLQRKIFMNSSMFKIKLYPFEKSESICQRIIPSQAT